MLLAVFGRSFADATPVIPGFPTKYRERWARLGWQFWAFF
jgi:hypothetical protein